VDICTHCCQSDLFLKEEKHVLFAMIRHVEEQFHSYCYLLIHSCSLPFSCLPNQSRIGIIPPPPTSMLCPAESLFLSHFTRARILKHFEVTAEKIPLGKVNFSSRILKTILLFINSCLPLWPGDLFFSHRTECSSASHPSKKTACVFKNPENAGIVRKISFQVKSYLFNLHEMFKNLGSALWQLCLSYVIFTSTLWFSAYLIF
jgi:hypothetical protein